MPSPSSAGGCAPAPARGHDLVVVGAGIVGLAHAYEGVRRGHAVTVVDAQERCLGASVRNFGFVSVSGQRPGSTWERALASRRVWQQVCAAAGIEVLQRGAWVVCQRQEALALAQEFLATPAGRDCRLYRPLDFPRLQQAQAELAGLSMQSALALLHSPHEMRVDSATAIARLTTWLSAQGVEFHWRRAVTRLEGSRVYGANFCLAAKKIVLCIGADYARIEGLQAPAVQCDICTLPMLRIRPPAGYRLPGCVLTDHSLIRYPGWAMLPGALALRARLQRDTPQMLANGVHLIAVQDRDGCLVVGDAHHYGPTEQIFMPAAVEALILDLMRQTLRLDDYELLQRWTGTYPRCGDQDVLVQAVSDQAYAVVVTSGTGASTAFALASETLDLLYA